MDFQTYQDQALLTDQNPAPAGRRDAGPEMMIPLLGLAGEAGELLSEYKKFLRDGDAYKVFPERIAEELGDLLWYVANVASKFGLDLDEVAKRNLEKCRDRWGARLERPLAVGHGSPFDVGYPPDERIPATMEVEISPVGQGIVTMTINGKKTGDDLTDNSYEDDGYRFHDVFHLACAAVLGWSPVLRKLLKKKRKSNPEVDKVQDGGRAAAIEEGISALVWSYAHERSDLDGVGVSYEVLRTIRSMTTHLEVSRCSLGEWELAIQLCFKVWREIRKRDGGRFVVDLNARTIEVAPKPGG